MPPQPRYRRPSRIRPGADAGGDLEVDQVGRAAAGAVDGSASAPRFASLSTLTGHVEPLAQLLAGGDADPAGQDRRRADHAVDLVDRAREAEPGADHASVDARLGEQLLDQVAARRRALLGRRGRCRADRALGEDRRRQVGHRDAHVVVAEVDAERGAGRGVEREQDRWAAALLSVRRAGLRALDRRGRRTAARRRGSRPSSATSPCGARSRRALIMPCARSASITRRRLSRRSDASEPSRPLPHPVGMLTSPASFAKVSNEPSSNPQQAMCGARTTLKDGEVDGDPRRALGRRELRSAAAMAGRMTSVSPSPTSCRAPSSTRTSSSLR